MLRAEAIDLHLGPAAGSAKFGTPGACAQLADGRIIGR